MPAALPGQAAAGPMEAPRDSTSAVTWGLWAESARGEGGGVCASPWWPPTRRTGCSGPPFGGSSFPPRRESATPTPWFNQLTHFAPRPPNPNLQLDLETFYGIGVSKTCARSQNGLHSIAPEGAVPRVVQFVQFLPHPQPHMAHPLNATDPQPVHPSKRGGFPPQKAIAHAFASVNRHPPPRRCAEAG